MDLTDAQWAVLEPLFRPKRREDRRGRPWQDTRAVLNGVFWVLRTGAPWHDLPSRYPPYQTCHRRFQSWQRSASPHETKLVETTLEQRFLRETPERMIGDRAYDSDPLDQRIQQRYGVQLIAPHRFVRVSPATQDGRGLRRYRRRWKIERLFAWLHNFRRVVIRWEYYPENFLGMVQLACAVILLRHL